MQAFFIGFGQPEVTLVSDPGMAEIKEKALELLSYREHSERELLDKLLVRKFPKELSMEVIRELRRKDYLNDIRFATGFIRQRIRTKPVGRKALISMLGAKGIPHRVVEQLVREVLDDEGLEEKDLANRVIEKELHGKLLDENSVGRLRNLLLRRGFDAHVVGDLLGELTETRTCHEVEEDVEKF